MAPTVGRRPEPLGDARPAGCAHRQRAKPAGPGAVTFAAAAIVDTTAGFSAAGAYSLSLIASDTQLSSDTMKVSVTDANAPVTNTFNRPFTTKPRTVAHTFSSVLR